MKKTVIYYKIAFVSSRDLLSPRPQISRCDCARTGFSERPMRDNEPGRRVCTSLCARTQYQSNCERQKQPQYSQSRLIVAVEQALIGAAAPAEKPALERSEGSGKKMRAAFAHVRTQHSDW